MQIVIEIDEEEYRQIVNDEWYMPIFVSQMIKNGTPLQEQSKWIPVSERLPEIHQDILMSLRSLEIYAGFRAEEEPYFNYFYCRGVDGCYIEPQNVLAWMPLPTPYVPDINVGEMVESEGET